jgi:hypothetical protein
MAKVLLGGSQRTALIGPSLGSMRGCLGGAPAARQEPDRFGRWALQGACYMGSPRILCRRARAPPSTIVAHPLGHLAIPRAPHGLQSNGVRGGRVRPSRPAAERQGAGAPVAGGGEDAGDKGDSLFSRSEAGLKR